MGSGINYKRDDYMVKKLLDILNKKFNELVVIDDSIYDNSTIYKLIDLCFFDENIYDIIRYDLTDEEYEFIMNFACKDIPKPKNLSEQLKYLDLCRKFEFIDKVIAERIESGKPYDISDYKYVFYKDFCIVENGVLTERINDIDTIGNVTLVNGMLTLFDSDGSNELKYNSLTSRMSKDIHIMES